MDIAKLKDAKNNKVLVLHFVKFFINSWFVQLAFFYPDRVI